MRLRNIPGADEVIANSSHCIHEPEKLLGKWHDYFPKNQDLHIEIGMGKGQFIINMAIAHPDINYIGIERYTSVILRAVQKLESLENDGIHLDNLKFLCFDAKNIDTIFAPGEVDKIYLNFSDPWPKDRHTKRRLTSREFLARYDKILRNDGFIEFKTDNVDLFNFSLDEINDSDIWKLDAHTFDLHHDAAMNVGNIMTEYEEKFSSQGNPICKLICSRI